MLTLLKGSAVAAGVLAATVTGVVFAQAGRASQGSASGITVSAGVPLTGSRSHHRHHGHHGHHSVGGRGSGSASGGAATGGAGSGAGGSGAGGSGSGGPAPGGPHKVLTPLRPAFPPAALEVPSVPTLPTPSGSIGLPGVPCLNGYIWRQAYSGDYVCVTPAQQSQAAADNAAAQGRIQSGGGAYGPYTCQQGYVWRQVVPDDYVCVTPAERAQAAADNAQAGNRVALLSLWISDWAPPPSQPQQNCSGGVCTTTEGGWDGPNIQINGDHFNYGPVVLEIRRNDGTVLWSGVVDTGPYTGFLGGAFAAQTDIGDCSQVPNTTNNDYAIAYDTVSGRWSNQVPVDSSCASL